MFTPDFSKKEKVVKSDGSTEPVHIAVCFDENMDMPFLALAESLRYSIKNRHRSLIIHAIYRGQLSETVSRLTSHNSNNFIVEFIRANIELQTLPLRDVFTHATYTRLYLHIILSDIHKVVYLDPDTIVVNDISKLYDTELSGCCLAASQDRGTAMMHSEYGFKVDKKIGLNAKHGDDINTYLRNVIGLKNGNEHLYFNDGVLLIDLDLWRSMNILGLAIDFLHRNPDCLYLGQDALNAVLSTRYTILDDRWNSLAILVNEYHLNHFSYDSVKIINKWRNDPWIVHYAGPNKPWRADRDRTMLDFYFWNAAKRSFAYPSLKRLHYASTPPMSKYKETRKFSPTLIERFKELIGLI